MSRAAVWKNVVLYALGAMHKTSGQCHCNKPPSSCSFFAGALFSPNPPRTHPHSGAFIQHLFTIFSLFQVVAHLGELVSLFSEDLRHFFSANSYLGDKKNYKAQDNLECNASHL